MSGMRTANLPLAFTLHAGLCRGGGGRVLQASLQRAALETQIDGVRKEWSERQAVLREQLGRRQQDIAQKMRAVTSDSKARSVCCVLVFVVFILPLG